MRIIEIINLSMEYNELLVKFTLGQQWLDDPNVPQHKIEKFFPKWNALLKDMDKILTQFESIGIKFRDCETTQCIEIPEKFKRNNVEKKLEIHYKLNNFKKAVNPDSEKTYKQQEREGMKLY